MTKPNPKNERIKVQYEDELINYQGLADSTINQKLDAIYRYEEITDFKDFSTFAEDLALTFKDALVSVKLAAATKLAIMNNVRNFFEWLAREGHLKSRVQRRAIALLRLSRKDTRAGQASAPKKYATISEFRQILSEMPTSTDIEHRDRALIALTALCGARAGALISLRIKHVDFEKCEVLQHPNEVNTKSSKLIVTWFFPVGHLFGDIVRAYVDRLRNDLGFSDNDPLFPQTCRGRDENDHFISDGLTKQFWANTDPVRKIFKTAFQNAGFKYRNPHRIRNTLMGYAAELGLNGKELKAWSQNLGHEHLLTSLNCYGKLSHEDQRKSILRIDPENRDKNRPATVGEMEKMFAKIAPSTSFTSE